MLPFFKSTQNQSISHLNYCLNKQFGIIFVITLIFFTKVQSALFVTPLSQIDYDNSLIQTGNQIFNQPMNVATTSPNYQGIITRTFTKMNLNLPNAYQVYLSWRGVNIYFHQFSLGPAAYYLGVIQKNQTDIKIQVLVNYESTLIHIVGNYILIHEYLVTNQFMYGKYILENTSPPCTGTAVPSAAVCNYPQAFAIPTGYTPIIFISYLFFNRDQAYTTLYLSLQFKLEIIDPNNINIKLQFGQLGFVYQFAVSVLVYKDTLADSLIKKVLLLFPFQTPIPINSASSINYIIPLPSPLKVYNQTLFAGLSRIVSMQMQFCYDVYPDPVAFTLNGYIYFPIADAFYKGLVMYGYICPDPYYFNQLSRQCQTCPILNCYSCISDLLLVITCKQCVDNYFVSADKLSCQCNMNSAASVCDTLSFPEQLGCLNAQRVNGNIQCLFCSPVQFKILSNNYCICQTGYNDDNHDGVCEETCGDGLIFNAECDDGNLVSNDGCNSTCSVEKGFKCDKSQPSFCSSLSMIRYKFGKVKKIDFSNTAEITLLIKNSKDSLPFPILIQQFLPESSYLKLFFQSTEGNIQEMQITNLNLIEIDGNYMIRFSFDYNITLECFDGKILLNYEKTRYLQETQQIRFSMKGIDNPLIYSDNVTLYKIIAYGLFAITIFNFIGFIINFFTPKFIGFESILTLQLIFYSQLLIDDTSKWPVGFMAFKYLKFSSGFNEILSFTDYNTLSTNSKKYFHLQMNKTLIENFNINFMLLFLSFLIFIVIFLIKFKKQTQFQRYQFNRKYLHKGEYQQINNKQLIKSIDLFKYANDKAFWVVNYFAFWLILPLMGSISTQIMIQNNLVSINTTKSLQIIFSNMGSIIGFVSFSIIFVICMNHFMNLWLSRQSVKKIGLKPQEIKYKRVLFIYLFIIGTMILFLNKTHLLGCPFSVFVVIFQVGYTVWLIFINPYQQSLKIHTVTLLLNQCIYILFLVLVNMVNLFSKIRQLYVLIFEFLLIFLCLISVILTFIRLYYQLKYGDQLEREIQKQKQKQNQFEQLRKHQLYKKKLKKLQNSVFQQLTDSQKLRVKNKYLFQNQLNEDKARDLMRWVEQKKWDSQDKEKYFIEKSGIKPVQWLQKYGKEQFYRLMTQKEEYDLQRRNKREMIMNDKRYRVISDGLRNEVSKNVETWKRKLERHERRIRKDLDYAMNMSKNGNDKLMKMEYQLKQ